jgi:hypothetical protein
MAVIVNVLAAVMNMAIIRCRWQAALHPTERSGRQPAPSTQLTDGLRRRFNGRDGAYLELRGPTGCGKPTRAAWEEAARGRPLP